MPDVFLDTGYAIALASPRDQYHQRSLELASMLVLEGTRIVTTRAVSLEIGNALSKRHHRIAAIRLLESLDSDPRIEIVPLTMELYMRAFELFRDRTDKDWSLTDCASFVVMRDRQIHGALTPDEHFVQAGFLALMREPSH